MKKWFTLCMAVLLLLGVFAGCTKGGSGGETTTAETTTSPLETKSAAITGNTAIRLLESYSKKELGLDNVGKKNMSLCSAPLARKSRARSIFAPRRAIWTRPARMRTANRCTR